jgi:PmbA protein
MSQRTSDPTPRLLELAQDLVDRARKLGADVAEASARTGSELSGKVRLGNVELVEEAGHHGVSLRVIRGGRVATTSTSDLTPRGLERCVADALELCALSQPDDCAGPAPVELLCQPPHPDLELLDESIDAIDADYALAQARLAERAALDADSRIKLSEGATFSRTSGASALVLSSGFQGAVRGSYAVLSVAPVVEDEGGKKRRGHYYSATRQLSDLEPAEAIGREAARRTLRKLGARKVPTTEAPVVFDPDVARSLVGALAGCIVGGALWRKSSYLLEREGTLVASPLVDIVDDPLILRGPGSRPFDGEGLRSRKNVIVERGTLKGFLLDCYSAKKLGRASTASASRGGGSIGASTSNFVLDAGRRDREEHAARTVRHGADGLWLQPHHERLLARCRRLLDRKRGACLPGERDHHLVDARRDAQGHRRRGR